jgi:hypothetical protein
VTNAGAVDFALLFVANYGSARGKKYSEPTDLAHAVEMLRVVLGQVRLLDHMHGLRCLATKQEFGMHHIPVGCLWSGRCCDRPAVMFCHSSATQEGG